MCHLKTTALLVFLIFSFQNTYAQLGFCGGNSGDPIFTEDFGTGTTSGPALATGVTSYDFDAISPDDGRYTIASNSNYFDWHNTNDHTPGDVNGKMLIINADFTAGQFYQTNISGLCENTSYEFSAFLLSLAETGNGCGANLIPVNASFQIWDDTNTNLLASGDTGNLYDTASPLWISYGLLFKSESGQTSVILKMINNATGGCGNDLAIDDIVFKSCGDIISLTNDPDINIITQCEDEVVGLSTTITATPDFSIYNSHAYQWQESSDNINWVDLIGETSNNYTTPALLNSRFFRVKVAQDPVNLPNPFCNVVSEVFNATITTIPNPNPPISSGDVAVCANLLTPLSVNAPNDEIVSWYDSPSGGNLLLENSTSFTPTTSGTFYAAASSNLTDCFSFTRTGLNYTIYELPVVDDETILHCANTSTTLSAGIRNVAYEWNTGETTESIEVATPGVYTMTATNANGCTALKTITVEQIDQPVIDEIKSDNDAIIISTVTDGEFEYALNSGSYQDSPVFEMLQGGLYTVNVRGKNNCLVVSQEFIHLVVPKFFTPNGDTFNDSFILEGLEFFTNTEVQIFDRYGALLKQSTFNSFSWNGTFKGRRLPSSDYWYVIKADDRQFKGHFTLKR